MPPDHLLMSHVLMVGNGGAGGRAGGLMIGRSSQVQTLVVLGKTVNPMPVCI